MIFQVFNLISLVFIFLFLITASGNLLISLGRNKNLFIINPAIIGISIFYLLIFTLYFLLDFSYLLSLILSIIFLTLMSLVTIFFNYGNIFKLTITNYIIVFPLIIIFIIFCIIYEDNFFVFRGNHWDYFYYLSQSFLVSGYNYDFLLKNNSINLSDFNDEFVTSYFSHSSGEFIFHNVRPTIFLIFASIFLIPVKNIFLSAFIIKITLTAFISLSLFSFINYYLKNKLKSVFIALVFSLSFWPIYLEETDALAQIASLPIFLSLLYSSLLIFYKDENFKNLLFLKTILLLSLYIIYPGFLFCILIFYLILLVYNYKKFMSLFFYDKILFSISFLISLIFFIISYEIIFQVYFYEQSVKLKNIQSISSSINLWGYYGGFIIGSDSIINNYDLIDQLKLKINNLSSFETIKEIIIFLKNYGYNFFYLNLVPSFFGLYYMSVSNVNNGINFYELTFIILINIYLIFLFFKNLIFNLKCKDIFSIYMKITIIYFVIFSLLLISLNELYYLIKFYISLSSLIFIYMILNRYNNKINYIYLILILSFIPYKFFVDNNGIGKFDSLPSIIQSDYKKKFNWKFDDKSGCKNFYIDIDTAKLNKFSWIKYNFLNLRLTTLIDKNDKNSTCIVSDISNKFQLKKIK